MRKRFIYSLRSNFVKNRAFILNLLATFAALQNVAQMPRNSLAFPIQVCGQNNAVNAAKLFFQFGDNFFGFWRNYILRLKIVFNVNAKPALGQVAHVAV